MAADEFDLTLASEKDPLLGIQRFLPGTVLKWYIPAWAIVLATTFLVWTSGSLPGPTPGLIPFVWFAASAAVLTAYSGYLVVRGPRPRRLPFRLMLTDDRAAFVYRDGERVEFGWHDRGLWLQLSQPSHANVWDPTAGELLVDARGGPEAVARRQAKLFAGMPVPGPMMKYRGHDAVLSPAAYDAVLNAARRAGCRLTTWRGGSWEGWLVREPLTPGHFWAD